LWGLSRLFAIIQLCSLLPQNICKYSKFDFALLAQRAMVPQRGSAMTNILNELQSRRDVARMGGGQRRLMRSMRRENSLRANGLICC
jgi:hypothetical protein